jgi:hypothetical protein
MGSEQQINGFKRTLIDGNMMIKSVCVVCGTVICGGVSNGLERDEESHLAVCAKPETHLFVLL